MGPLHSAPIIFLKNIFLKQNLHLLFLDTTLLISSSLDYSALNASISFHRETSNILMFQMSTPLLLAVLSWLNYFLDPEQVAARVSLGITTILSCITQGANIYRGLPQLPYSTVGIWEKGFIEKALNGA